MQVKGPINALNASSSAALSAQRVRELEPFIAELRAEKGALNALNAGEWGP